MRGEVPRLDARPRMPLTLCSCQGSKAKRHPRITRVPPCDDYSTFSNRTSLPFGKVTVCFSPSLTLSSSSLTSAQNSAALSTPSPLFPAVPPLTLDSRHIPRLTSLLKGSCLFTSQWNLPCDLVEFAMSAAE